MFRLAVVGALVLGGITSAMTAGSLLIAGVLPYRILSYVNSPFATAVLLDVDRRLPIELIDGVYSPTGSPDGQQLAFYAPTFNNQRNIYTLDLYNRRVRRLTFNGANNHDPTWSPDGREIAFASNYGNAFGIFAMDVDCVAPFEVCATRLTPIDDNWYAAPAWSPDGQQIAFVATLDTLGSFDTSLGNSNLYIINSDGTNMRRITTNLGEDYTPAWSPDSRSLVYAAQNIQNSSMDIMMMDVDCPILNGCQRQVYSDVVDLMPSWSPDGREIVFVDVQDGNYEIWIAASDGSSIQQITDNDLDEITPRWWP
ncbi:MAG: hypothetical protein LCI00_21595 [Chloroflexi bacterium]|nr:hypothetical protein [Chloroflexota bacterium]MCC6895010.1 PD40 domain-containing protein [Anaerolineae bacterium]